MRIDAIVKNNSTFKTMIFKLCCISRVPVIFHLLCLEFWRLKKSCNSTSYAQMRKLLLVGCFKNVFITNGIWILLQLSTKSNENRIGLQTVKCFFLRLRSCEQNRDSQLSLFHGGLLNRDGFFVLFLPSHFHTTLCFFRGVVKNSQRPSYIALMVTFILAN